MYPIHGPYKTVLWIDPLTIGKPRPVWERNLEELRHWVKENHGGMSINYAGFAVVTSDDDVPTPWTCAISKNHTDREGHLYRENYIGYGVTMTETIQECYRTWQND